MAKVECTAHCKKRFKEANGVSLPDSMGNANQWADYDFEGTSTALRK